MVKKPIYILGISSLYHDSAAALVRDGEIIAAAQEERFTRQKHDASFPVHSIAYCLKEAGIGVGDLNCVAYYEKPSLKFHRILMTHLQYAPRGREVFVEAMQDWIGYKLFVKNLIRREVGYDGKVEFVRHHDSHAASAFFPSPFEEAAIVTIDGVGEWTTTSIGSGKGRQISSLKEIQFPHSLGLLYSAFTYYAGFRVNSGEYKLMGLAPYGEPKYVDLIKKHLIDIKEDGSFHMNMDYFDYCVGFKMINSRFCDLFGGPARVPESPITQKDMDIAKSIQDVTQEIMLKTARYAKRVTSKDYLCLAGGVALNCVGNGRIALEKIFKKVWIQPAAGDAGCALGSALYVWHQTMGNVRVADGHHDSQKGSYLGPDYSREIDGFIELQKIPSRKLSKENLAKEIASLIAQENVIGLFHGRMEYGPRALGARSIIGDARSAKMQSLMNLKIKFRESFRPFAPSVLAHKAREYFTLEQESPYMLLVAQVQEQQLLQVKGDAQGLERLKVSRSKIPAVTHVDNSARMHTVTQETNPFFYAVLEEFDRLTGVPVIINTSFNVRGEPIVCTPQDAYRCFMCTNMDYLVLGEHLISKAEQKDVDKYTLAAISRELD